MVACQSGQPNTCFIFYPFKNMDLNNQLCLFGRLAGQAADWPDGWAAGLLDGCLMWQKLMMDITCIL